MVAIILDVDTPDIGFSLKSESPAFTTSAVVCAIHSASYARFSCCLSHCYCFQKTIMLTAGLRQWHRQWWILERTCHGQYLLGSPEWPCAVWGKRREKNVRKKGKEKRKIGKESSTHTLTHTHTDRHTQTYTQTHTLTHTHTHTNTETHTKQIDTHTCIHKNK